MDGLPYRTLRPSPECVCERRFALIIRHIEGIGGGY